MSEAQQLLSPEDKSLIKKWLIGGATIGGGTALATSLLNYLHHINDLQKENDDDTLYIVRKKNPEENGTGDLAKNASLSGGIAISGGLLATLGTYALVRKLYENMRKSEAQAELDKYQKAFLDVQGYEKADKNTVKAKKNAELDKSASTTEATRPMSFSEGLWSLPVAVPILVALGSGVMAKKVLDNAYPIAKKKKVEGPKRVEIVDDADEIAEKMASAIPDSCGLELLYRTVQFRKEASSSISDLIGAIASGEAGRFEKAASCVGFADALAVVKGAAAEDVDPVSEQIAITYMAKKASIAPQTALVAASEFAEFYPNFFKTACALDDKIADEMVKVAKLLGYAFKNELLEEHGVTYTEQDEAITKQASTTDFIMDKMMSAAVDSSKDSDEKDNTKPEEDGKKKIKYIYSSKRGLRLAKMLQDEDVIDKIMNPS